MSWLSGIASDDGMELAEAALWLARARVVVSAQDWVTLGTAERAALVVARRAVEAEDAEAAGQDMTAARIRSTVDGGVSAARLMAQAAVTGAAEALRQARANGSPR